MDYEMRKMINSLAEDVILQYNIKVPIDDINDVVKTLGGTIIEDNSINLLAIGNSSICKSANGFTICLYSFQSEKKKRLVIAHELGHLFLHMGYGIDEELWKQQDIGEYYGKGAFIEEVYQANEFAAAFLMPECRFNQNLHNILT